MFPHEVVGFSGGNKYFFPGIAGSDIINFTHWLSALITSYHTIGIKDTPTRRVIDRAAAFIPRPRHALCSVITREGVAGLFVGTTEDAWSAAADLSAQRHVIWKKTPYRQVLSVLPAMYDEMWVGAKGMYKTEPAIADGGEVIIYAPTSARSPACTARPSIRSAFGARLASVVPGGPADRAGLRAGDALLAVDETTVEGLTQGGILMLIYDRPVGAIAAMTVARGEARITAAVKIASPSD